jgi:hypothetical protein
MPDKESKALKAANFTRTGRAESLSLLECGSSNIDGIVIVLLGRMMILYNSEWTIFKITALSA